MLCVLFANKPDRQKILTKINTSNCIWSDSSIDDVEKLIKVFNNNENSSGVKIVPTQMQILRQLPSQEVLNKVFIIKGKISLDKLLAKNLHDNWENELHEKFQQLVGKNASMESKDGIIDTYVLWLPGVSTMYLPFA